MAISGYSVGVCASAGLEPIDVDDVFMHAECILSIECLLRGAKSNAEFVGEWE